MLVCHVSQGARRVVIAADVTEAAAALDAATQGIVVFATLVDDPANVLDRVDAFVGQIMLEAATAASTVNAGLVYSAAIVEAAVAADATSASLPSMFAASVAEAAAALDNLSAAAAVTTWNPADKSANITLSGGNLTVGASNTSDGGVRSTTSRSSGKVYFEIDWTSSSGTDTGCGIATGSASLSLGSTSVGGVLVYDGGNIWINGSSSGVQLGGGLGIVSGTICVAVDLNNSRIWMRKDNQNWNNSGSADPATNAGGLNISALFPTNVAYAVITMMSTFPTSTANFGATAFQQTVPSGFSAWN